MSKLARRCCSSGVVRAAAGAWHMACMPNNSLHLGHAGKQEEGGGARDSQGLDEKICANYVW